MDTNRPKSLREDAQWFFDLHPVAYAFWVFVSAFTIFAFLDCLWAASSERSFAMHVVEFAARAGFFALFFSAFRYWRKARRM